MGLGLDSAINRSLIHGDVCYNGGTRCREAAAQFVAGWWLVQHKVAPFSESSVGGIPRLMSGNIRHPTMCNTPDQYVPRATAKAAELLPGILLVGKARVYVARPAWTGPGEVERR
jgi:hypothetical protein